jgi:broad specificity phosphatase PhoE
MKEKSPFSKSIIIMRHGERIDCVDSKSNQLLTEYDPELTEKGIKQALDIGNQIKKCLKKDIDTINLYSSPFTRTLMTGLNIIEKLSLKNNNIFIANGLFEIASLNNFKYYPLDSLLINNKNENKNLYSKFINNYLEKIDNFEGIKKFKEKEIEPKYPENFVDAVNRYTKIAKELFDEICNNSNNSINIIVTHGYGVQVITEYFFGKTRNKEELLAKEDFFVDYCTSYCFNFINDKEIKFIGRIDPSFD